MPPLQEDVQLAQPVMSSMWLYTVALEGMPAAAGVVVLDVELEDDVVVPAGVLGVEGVAVVSGDEEDVELVPAEVPADVELDVFTCWEPLAEGELTLVFPPQPKKTVRTTNSVGRKRRRMKG